MNVCICVWGDSKVFSLREPSSFAMTTVDQLWIVYVYCVNNSIHSTLMTQSLKMVGLKYYVIDGLFPNVAMDIIH